MRFADLVVSEAFRIPLSADDGPGVIEELVAGMAGAEIVSRRAVKTLTRAVTEREAFGSTALGRGIAIPHAKHRQVERTATAVGVHRQGVDFAGLDGNLTHVFFLTLSPPERAYDHQQALRLIATHVRDETFVRFMMQAQTTGEMMALLEEADAASPVTGTRS